MSGDVTARIAGLLAALRAGAGAAEGPAWFDRRAEELDRLAEQDPVLADSAQHLAERARARARCLRRGGAL